MKKTWEISPKSVFLVLFIVCFLAIGSAILFYGSNFQLLYYPFSYSGATLTKDNLPNLISYYLFTAGMVLSGIVMLFLNVFYINHKPKKILKIIFTASGAIGFIITAFSPINIYHKMHVLGSWLAVFSLWMIAMVYLVEVRNKTKITYFIFLHFILQIPMIIYAITFFLLINPLSFLMQKISMFTLFLFYT